MLRISSVVTNYDSASSGFSEGKLRDNPGDDTGSSVVAAIDNDSYYARLALISKYLTGGITDTPESENNSDFLNGIEEMIGYKVNTISSWSAATTYTTLDEKVMRSGMQFVCINTTSNINLDPLTNPLHWMAVPSFRALFEQYNHGSLIYAAHQLHDYNNAKYRQYFSLGLHKVGGASGTSFNAWGVHVDGSAVGSGALSTIIETWYLKTPFAPGSTGSRTLKDARGKVPRGVDATGGQADEIGEVLEDQTQGFNMTLYSQNTTADSDNPSNATLAFINPSTTKMYKSGTAALAMAAGTVKDRSSDGVNGTPRTGTRTRDQSITVGVPYMVIMVPA